MEFSRQEHWSGSPFSRASSWLRDQTRVFCIAGRFFTIRATREAPLPFSKGLQFSWRDKTVSPETIREGWKGKKCVKLSLGKNVVRSSQSTKLSSLCYLAATCFTHGHVYTSARLSQFAPLSPSPGSTRTSSTLCLCSCLKSHWNTRI